MGIFIFGTLWFWLLITITGGLILYILESALWDSEDDSGGGLRVTLVLIGAGLLYYFFGSKEDIISIFTYIKENPSFVLSLFAGYLFIGVIWSIAKWYFFLLNKKEYYLRSNIPFHRVTAPKANKNKARIMSWMMYWPFSGLWTLINEPIKKAFQLIYRNIEGLFDRMSDKIFNKDIQDATNAYELEKKQEQEERERRSTKKIQLND
jgi:hypothetical protein